MFVVVLRNSSDVTFETCFVFIGDASISTSFVHKIQNQLFRFLKDPAPGPEKDMILLSHDIPPNPE